MLIASSPFFRNVQTALGWRLVILVATALASFTSLAQITPAHPGAESTTVRDFRPDVTIVIRKHSTGADLCEVSLLSNQYRPQEFQRRLLTLETVLGNRPRGLNLFAQDLSPKNRKPSEPKLVFLKATFAVDGLILPDQTVHLQPLVQIFAGGEGAENVSAMQVLVSDFRPKPATLQRFDSEAVQVLGQAVGQPPMLEYRIWLKSQNPSQIQIPDQANQNLPTATKASHGQGPSPVLVWIFLGLTSIAAAVLVYNLALRARPNKTKPAGRLPHH